MIDKKTVKHVAKLARLELSEKEVERFQKELCAILGYVGELEEIDPEISELASIKNLTEKENVMREDEVNFIDKSEKLLALAPQIEKGYLKVKSILK